MAINPETGIDYDADRFVVVTMPSGEIINFNAPWLRPDGGPLAGGNPNLMYYKKVTADPPAIDHRFTLVTASSLVDTDPAPPEGHPAGEYVTGYTPQKLPVADLKRQVDDQFQAMVRLYFPASSDPALALEITGALQAVSENRTLTENQSVALLANAVIADGIAQNRGRVAELYAAIDADDDYDITDGWVPPVA